ncbi:hypothetical protein E2C01_001306 [Portunus trituberculatus]|uniref:Uncharacterized protein n=1 Tax=Portunus trituberculatus TaxID=210409 RepID=A0A5B7CGD1_PORTR|nr:hypothetical protein [Portunus trituberculatus]
MKTQFLHLTSFLHYSSIYQAPSLPPSFVWSNSLLPLINIPNSPSSFACLIGLVCHSSLPVPHHPYTPIHYFLAFKTIYSRFPNSVPFPLRLSRLGCHHLPPPAPTHIPGCSSVPQPSGNSPGHRSNPYC